MEVILEVIDGPDYKIVEEIVEHKSVERLVGDRGLQGPPNDLSIGEVTTGAPGSSANVIITGVSPSQMLDFIIPRGDKGETGDTGPANELTVGDVSTGLAGSDAAINITGTSPDQTINFTIPRGDKGEQGEPNTLTIGTVETGPDSAADITGTSPNQTLNLTLEAGPPNILSIGTVDTGVPGSLADAAITGISPSQTLSLTIPRGDKGETGDVGPANQLTVGTVDSTTAAPEVTITGEPPNQIINFVLEKGEQGIQGEQGEKGDPGTGNVNTVNGELGPDIILDAADVGAEPTVAAGTVGDYYRGDKTWQALNKSVIGLSNVDNTSDVNKPISTATQTVLNTKADLVGGVIPSSQLPPLAINDTFVVESEAEMLGLAAQRGDIAIRTDEDETYILAVDDATVLANWKEIMAGGQVVSVAGKTGTVVLEAADITSGTFDVARIPVHNHTSSQLPATIVYADTDQTISGEKTHTNVLNAQERMRTGFTTDVSSTAPLEISGLEVEASSQSMITFGETAAGSANPQFTMYRTSAGFDRRGKGFRQEMTTSGPINWQWGTSDTVYGTETFSTAMSLDRANKLTVTGDVAASNFIGNGANLSNLSASSIATGMVALTRLPVASSGTSNATQLVRADDSRLSNARVPTTHVHSASDISSGVIATARLGAGTANTTTFLRGDNTWAVVDVDSTVPIQTAEPTGESEGTFWFDSDDVSIDGAANITRVIHDGTSYPARPAGAVYVEWVGPEPTEMITGDSWSMV